MTKALLLVASLVFLAAPAQASEPLLGRITITAGSTNNFVATGGASLVVICPRPLPTNVVSYSAGSSGSPPDAGVTSYPIPVAGLPIRLAATEDRISLYGPPGVVCSIYSSTAPPLTATSTTLASCLSVTHHVVSAPTDGGVFAAPVSPQAGRVYAEVCVSAENSGSPKVKCLTDPAAGKPAMGLSEPGNVLQTGALPCVTYPVDATHLIKCVSDTVATAVTVDECVGP